MMKNSTEERMQILKMIEEGKITAQEGLELMNAVDQGDMEENPISSKRAKWLKVRIMSLDGRVKTKVNIPISLVDIGLKLGTAYSPELKDSSLNKIDFKELLEAVKNGAEGKMVEVEDDERQERIEVFVE